MKIKILILVSFFCFKSLLAQEGEVAYKVESIKKTHLDAPMIKGVIKEYSIMTHTLSYNKQHSFFKINKGLPYNKKWYNLAKIFIQSNQDWHQNAETNEAIHNQKIKNILYEVNFVRMTGWSITEETKKIQGYTCYKALIKIKNRNRNKSKNKNKNFFTFTAWFTPEIPAPYGPIGFGGLPGLILQLDNPYIASFIAKKITLNPSKKLKVPIPEKGVRINPDEQLKLMRLARMVTED